jgi:hypothetical protein
MTNPVYAQVGAEIDQRITDLENRMAILEQKTQYLSVDPGQSTVISAGVDTIFGVQQDGNVVVYRSGQPLWESNTAR